MVFVRERSLGQGGYSPPSIRKTPTHYTEARVLCRAAGHEPGARSGWMLGYPEMLFKNRRSVDDELDEHPGVRPGHRRRDSRQSWFGLPGRDVTDHTECCRSIRGTVSYARISRSPLGSGTVSPCSRTVSIHSAMASWAGPCALHPGSSGTSAT